MRADVRGLVMFHCSYQHDVAHGAFATSSSYISDFVNVVGFFVALNFNFFLKHLVCALVFCVVLQTKKTDARPRKISPQIPPGTRRCSEALTAERDRKKKERGTVRKRPEGKRTHQKSKNMNLNANMEKNLKSER